MFIKVGDLVRLKSKEELLKEGNAQDTDGDILLEKDGEYYVGEMNTLAGTTFRVGVRNYDEEQNIIGYLNGWTITQDMVTLVEEVENLEVGTEGLED